MAQSRPSPRTGRPPGRRWSGAVTRHSHALALEPQVFQGRSARGIAASLKRSAERSRARKGSPFQSAMSMLNFYINRAGRTLPRSRKRLLERAKEELRKLFGRDGAAGRLAARSRRGAGRHRSRTSRVAKAGASRARSASTGRHTTVKRGG